MIDLHPIPETDHRCPECDIELRAVDWCIPGMLMLADLTCPDCNREYYANLAAGQGLLNPAILEKDTGAVRSFNERNWFTNILEQAYADRKSTDVTLRQIESNQLAEPILLNCIDLNYIHCVGKLLNAEYYCRHYPNRDLIIIVPSFLRWMVPSEVDAIWAVDVSLSEGQHWNDELAKQIRSSVECFDTCSLSPAFLFPHPDEYDITNFTRVDPFPVDEWTNRLKNPTVTFIWRGAGSSARRLWCSWINAGGIRRKARGYLNLIDNKFGIPRLGLREQRRNIIKTARELRRIIPGVDCAVAGLKTSGTFPSWITDIRFDCPSAQQERQLCERYAKSHIVAGTHGSHMALPSVHAGGVVELVPHTKRGNTLSDLLFSDGEFREVLLRYRVLPTTVSNTTVAREISAVLTDWPRRRFRMNREWFRHDSSFDSLRKIKYKERRIQTTISEIKTERRFR